MVDGSCEKETGTCTRSVEDLIHSLFRFTLVYRLPLTVAYTAFVAQRFEMLCGTITPPPPPEE